MQNEGIAYDLSKKPELFLMYIVQMGYWITCDQDLSCILKYFDEIEVPLQLDCFLAIGFQSMNTLFKSSKIIVGHKVGDIDISLVVEVSTQELSKINLGGF